MEIAIELVVKLVPIYLIIKTIVLHGGVVECGSVVKQPMTNCLLTATRDLNKICWWRCELYPDLPHHYHQMSIIGKINSLGQGCYGCRKFKPIDGKFSSMPFVQAYWDWLRNDKMPHQYSYGSTLRCWFKCPLGHSYDIPCKEFNRGGRCGYCKGNRVAIGDNSFDTVPDAVEWYAHDLNKKPITYYKRGSNQKVWFRCPKYKHEFMMACVDFKQGSRCPICYRYPHADNNLSLTPDADEWYAHDINETPITSIRPNTKKKFWFRCPCCAFEFRKSAAKFTSGQRCPKCIGRVLIPGVNSFDLAPDVAKWWHPTKNTKQPYDYFLYSNIKVWFRCPEGHEYETPCADYTAGRRCNTCSRKSWEKNNFSLVPDANEWFDHVKNVKPITSYTMNNAQEVWFKCPKGHSFKMRCCVFKRGGRCKKCCKIGRSKQAIEFIECVRKRYGLNIRYANSPEDEFRIPGTRFRADGYIEINGCKIIFEYNGRIYHGDPRFTKPDDSPWFTTKTFRELYEKTIKKEDKIRELGYSLIVIWENDYISNRDNYISGNFSIDIIENALINH
ncbi:hypothetical protein F-VV10_0050 [Faustovirus]|nr:hypothetical protein F-VV10_0050 [Faustovirus]